MIPSLYEWQIRKSVPSSCQHYITCIIYYKFIGLKYEMSLNLKPGSTMPRGLDKLYAIPEPVLDACVRCVLLPPLVGVSSM